MRWGTKKWARAIVIGGVVGLLAASGAGGAAAAVEDTEPPDLKTPRRAEFVRHSEVTGWTTGDLFFTGNILARVPWVAEDAGSGICDVTVLVQQAGSFPKVVLSGAPASGSYTGVEYGL